jgi:hypothetical protein
MTAAQRCFLMLVAIPFASLVVQSAADAYRDAHKCVCEDGKSGLKKAQ